MFHVKHAIFGYLPPFLFDNINEIFVVKGCC